MARKNYMPSWSFTPYFYNRVSNWYYKDYYLDNMFNSQSVSKLRLSLSMSKRYWLDSNLVYRQGKSTPTFSGINTPGRSSWKPTYGVPSYSYSISVMSDILTKREYLYREYFLNKGFSVNLPTYLLSSPNNSLLKEVTKSFSMVDPSNFSSEVSRDFFYNNSKLFRFNVMKSFMYSTYLNNASNSINIKDFTNLIFLYVFNVDFNNKTSLSSELIKNQHRPMRKGISNMIRLQATGAIAMPTELRLHILASSKDIIHSWSIPSAGIKIDCVPGYSSHRVAIFLVSGIFWGQCMEICGRFHHWMPIIVHFMKRDLFFLWCTHFIHFSEKDTMFHMNDKQLTNKLHKVSFNKYSWSSEVIKMI